MSGLRISLRDASRDVFKTVDDWNLRTDGWLLPILAIPMLISFKAVSVLTSKSEQEEILAQNRENDMLYGIRAKCMYNPLYYNLTDEYRSKRLPDFQGNIDSYSVREMTDHLDSNFSKAWGSALIFGNREQNLTFISHYAIRKVGDRNDTKALRETLSELMSDPETFGSEIQAINNIEVDDVLANIEAINVEREAEIKKQAYSLISRHAYGRGEQNLEKVKEERARNANEWDLNRYAFSQEDVLNYAIDNADELIDGGFEGISEHMRLSTKEIMSMYRAQRDGAALRPSPECNL